MRKLLTLPVAAALVAGTTLTGCASDHDMGMNWMDTNTILGGAALGALVGTGLGVGVAAIGSTNLWTGALIGAGAGGALGAAGGAAASQPMY